MMALMMRIAIYLFDICLIASLCDRVRELLFWQSQAGGRAKIAWPRRPNTGSQVL
jgi:hypothetical protein